MGPERPSRERKDDGAAAEPAHASPADAADTSRERTDPRALEMLVCPLTKSSLEYDDAHQELVSRRAHMAYPIRCGVPLLTREAARNLDDPR